MNEPRRSPYQGLTPFDENDAEYFFGREKDARLIAADLFAAPVSVLYGASGVGKSSVLRAGVVPLLRPRDDLTIVVFNTWQSEPITPIKAAILEASLATFESPSPELRAFRDEVLRTEFEPLATFIPMCARATKRRFMIILDQFEEYSLYHPDGSAFSEQLPGATTIGDLSVSFLISLREDALARLDRFEGKIPALFDNLRRIDHLDAAAAREAIRKPLDKYNQDHAEEAPMSIDPELVEAVLEQVRTGRVVVGLEGGTGGTGAGAADQTRVEAPYLQLVMTRIWNHERNDNSTEMRWETLNSLGGAPRIVQTHLDQVMKNFHDEERDIAARVFQQLVTPSGTKIAHTVRDLADYAAVDRVRLEGILLRLSTGTDRVLRSVAAPPEWPDESRYEIFHDRLAGAILDWRSRYVKERALNEANLREIEQRARETVIPVGPGTARASSVAGHDADYALIAEFLKRGLVVVVVGSGLSASDRPPGARWTEGSGFPPNAGETKQLLAAEVGFPMEELEWTPFAALASFYATVTSREILTARLQRIFAPLDEPTRAHRLLARIASTTPLVVLTTTFDTLTEQAFDEARAPYELAYNFLESKSGTLLWRRPDGEFEVGSAKKFDPPSEISWIYKLFGSASRDALPSSYIVTEEDDMKLFSHISEGRLPPSQILSHMDSRSILFLGMGLGSWPQRLLLSKLRADGRLASRRGWAIARGVSKLDRMRWDAAKVAVYDDEIDDFVDRVSEILGLAV